MHVYPCVTAGTFKQALCKSMYILDTKQPPCAKCEGPAGVFLCNPLSHNSSLQILTDRAVHSQMRCPKRASANEGTLKPVAEQDTTPT